MSDNDFKEVKDIEEIDTVEDDKDKDKDKDYEDVCYICHRTESVAGKMIHIPNNICICNDCMQKTFDSMRNFGLNIEYQKVILTWLVLILLVITVHLILII